MNFIEAVRLLKINNLNTTNKIKMTRDDGRDIYLNNINEKEYAMSYNEEHKGWTIIKPSFDDILSENWYVVKNEELHTFEEAIAAFKCGKKIMRKSNKDDNIYYDEYFSDKDCLFDREDVMANDWLINNE